MSGKGASASEAHDELVRPVRHVLVEGALVEIVDLPALRQALCPVYQFVPQRPPYQYSMAR